MGDASEFDRVSRHYAVQSLMNACYFETMHVAASFLHGRRPECSCRPGKVANELKNNGLLPEEGLATLHESCQKCRLALDSAAAAWEQGEMNELRARLAEYRSVAKAVRTELVRLAR